MNLQDSHIEAAIKNGGQFLVKQFPPRASTYNALMTFPDGEGTVGNVARSPDEAMQNLEGALKLASGN